jgi:hypothetical protein
MKLIKNALLVVLLGAMAKLAWAGLGGPVATGALQQNADIIAVATSTAVVDSAGSVVVQLQLVSVLQGRPTSTSLTAAIPPAPSPLRGNMFSKLIGATGVWFLKRDASGYVILPLVQGYFSERDLAVPVADASPGSAPSGTVGHQILAYQLRWYQALPSPSPPEDEKLFASLIYNEGPDSADSIAALVSSTSPSQHALGLAAAIRLGSTDSVSQVTEELSGLRLNPMFSHVLSSLGSFPPLQTGAAVAAFEKLIGLHSDIPGLESAVSTTLVRIGNGANTMRSQLPAKAVLPGIVLLLDSTDPVVTSRAARFLGYFTLFADASGNIPGTGIIGPFATASTREFTPRGGSALTAAQYAAFWKVWWAQNSAALGF